ncbi:ABC transporter permease [Melghirimyces algeriensis]|uniref:ABC transporter permease n=1 Tax=Melghirimyces algeriensis TaxID=910412 RepID=UPI00163DC861|nr:ABC transporter permease [Melghirimyces algeriensis]
MIKPIQRMFKAEIKLFLREPFAMFFTLLFPVILLLLFGSVYGDMPISKEYRFIDTYMASLFAMVIANLGLVSIPITLADYRERGVLKQYQVTPVPKFAFLVVQVLVQIFMFLISAVLILAVAELVFDLKFGGNVLIVSGFLLFSMAMLYAVGFAIGGLASTVRTAQTAGMAVFFVLFFTSGAAIPRGEFPKWLQVVTDYVPLSHVVDVTSALWMGDAIGKHTDSLILITVLLVIALVVAKWKFRWQSS